MIDDAELMLNPVYRESSHDESEEDEDEENEDTMILNEEDEENEDDENSLSLTSEYKNDNKPIYNLLTVFNESVDDRIVEQNGNGSTKSDKTFIAEFVE